MIVILLVLTSMFALCACVNDTDLDINIGVMYSEYHIGKLAKHIVPIAIEDIDNSTDAYEFTIKAHFGETNCSGRYGLKAMVDIWYNMTNSSLKIDAFIGPACDIICEAGALLSSGWGIPMISYGCTQTTLSNKKLYPTFARTQASYSTIGPLIVQIMKKFNWDHISVITSTNREWDTTSDRITLFLEEADLKVRVSAYFNENVEHNLKTEFEKIRLLTEYTRVFLICANNEDTRDFLLHAYDMGLMNGSYAFITIDVILSSRFKLSERESLILNKSQIKRVHDQSYSAFEGILDITVKLNHSVKFDEEIIQRLKTKLNEQSGNNRTYTKKEISDDDTIIYAMMLYEAVWLYAVALNKSLSDGISHYDSINIAKRMFNITFKVGGNDVSIDENGDAIRNFVVRNLHNGDFHNVIKYNIRDHTIVMIDHPIYWPGGKTNQVLGTPICGWKNENCTNSSDTLVKIFIGIAVLFGISVFTCSFVWYRLQKKMFKLLHEGWRISFNDLKGYKSNKARSTFSYSKISMTLSENTMDNTASASQTMNIAEYEGNRVSVEMINKTSIVINSIILNEIKNAIQVKHINLNTFIGACVEPNHVCIISSYCSKGSLEDILANDNIKLDTMFKLSFISDISNGMAYLHKSLIKYHGHLNSATILIDGKWSCKISDYGLEKFKKAEFSKKQIDDIDDSYHSEDLYLAPELLRVEKQKRIPGQKSDIYSFAMVLYEIIEREPPFSNACIELNECIKRIMNNDRPYWRPHIDNECSDDALSKIIDLMRCCWDEYPGLRPSFNLVLDALSKINKGKQVNLVDQIIQRMERYADNLEDVVSERTQQLVLEQRKTDELLGRMLPKYIVDELKKGNMVQPEMYTSVTIFFSDIVGFTSMSASSTAFEVVDFLNDLYTTFDQIIDIYDVYKVETIGDAYMVASGLPIRNGNRHAGEIATMALTMNSSLAKFQIRHRPGDIIQMRIGIHTGAVCAGVVGLKMPRYCLFGDTVNYASRMESSGLALRIHISPDTKSTLDELGGYTLEERGEITMKGKGTVCTYFLTGKLGFNMPMADLSKAAPIAEHEFK